MIPATHAHAMARYNRWMNKRLYDCCATLTDEERKRDVGAFFTSIHGTLNHLLLGDRVWLGRFAGQPFAVSSPAQELYADFDELWRQRIATDDAIERWAVALTQADLQGELRYTSMLNPQPRHFPMWFAVSYFFNHQTHHRGQLTTLLFQRGIDPGVTDLVRLPEMQGQ